MATIVVGAGGAHVNDNTNNPGTHQVTLEIIPLHLSLVEL